MSKDTDQQLTDLFNATESSFNYVKAYVSKNNENSTKGPVL